MSKLNHRLTNREIGGSFLIVSSFLLVLFQGQIFDPNYVGGALQSEFYMLICFYILFYLGGFLYPNKVIIALSWILNSLLFIFSLYMGLLGLFIIFSTPFYLIGCVFAFIGFGLTRALSKLNTLLASVAIPA